MRNHARHWLFANICMGWLRDDQGIRFWRYPVTHTVNDVAVPPLENWMVRGFKWAKFSWSICCLLFNGGSSTMHANGGYFVHVGGCSILSYSGPRIGMQITWRSESSVERYFAACDTGDSLNIYVNFADEYSGPAADVSGTAVRVCEWVDNQRKWPSSSGCFRGMTSQQWWNLW